VETHKSSIQSGSVLIECVQGDISSQADIDVIVNAANAQLMPGGGVAGAIHAKAGPALAEECKSLAPIKTGVAVITRAFDLPNQYIIHCLGPVYGVDRPESKLLASCYRGALNLAETHGLKSIAFPAISTGIFGYPLRDAAMVSLTTILNYNAYKSLKRIRFVLWGQADWEVYSQLLQSQSK
jgi:O-acetyl-ADP-ribose deacetylase (regulator of RNase III)